MEKKKHKNSLFDCAVIGQHNLAEHRWLNFAERYRPVVVISQDAMNDNLETVVVCPLTSKIHPRWRSRLQITCAGKEAEIAVDQMRTISKNRLKQRVDHLPAAQASQLRRIITEMHGE
jgi:mRNA interferase MazF